MSLTSVNGWGGGEVFLPDQNHIWQPDLGGGGAHCLGGGGGLIHVRRESWNSNFPGGSVDSPPPPCLLYVQGSIEIKPVLESV